MKYPENILEIKGKFDRFDKEIELRVGKVSQWKKLHILADYYIENKTRTLPMDEYFKYEFYLRNREGRDRFSTYLKRRKFIDRFNEINARKWFDDKALFEEKFKDFIGRDSINMEIATFNEFDKFIKTHRRVFLKPTDGLQGIDTQILDFEADCDISDYYKLYSGRRMVAEEFIYQALELERFNTSCVNSLRVMTFLREREKVDIIPYAALRMGRAGKVADNFHNDGIAAMIDVETGYVITAGIDKYGNRWTVHPDSKQRIVGFHVPYWNEVCDCVRRAALVCPEVRFVGWDVALTDSGKAILIEGNSHPDLDVIEATDGVGKWYLLEKYIKSY